MQAAQAAGVAGLYKSIGAGSCGTVFEKLGTTHAVKLAKPGWNIQLWNDYLIHTRVLEAFKGATVEDLHIPKAFWFIEPKTGNAWWKINEDCFPPKYSAEPRPNVLCTERILPIPEELREAIIDLWCPDLLKSVAKAEPANNDCLVRVYLGASRRQRTRPLTMFQLRNFNLYVDQIRELNQLSDYEEVASNMGKALAIMHWRVGTDARDIEFVLGSAPALVEETPIPSTRLEELKEPISTWSEVTGHNFRRRAIRLWMLDFNQCRYIKPDNDGIATAVQAFFINDPYFPRPLTANSSEQRLWKRFQQGYLEVGKKAILISMKEQRPWKGEFEMDLPERFIKACVNEEQRRIKNRADAAARLEQDNY
jgi:hypothetical protein